MNLCDLKDLKDLEAAIVLSLRCKKRTQDQHGYWVDALEEKEFGSELWTLERSYLSEEVLFAAESFAKEALGWLGDRVQVKAEGIDEGILFRVVVDGKSYEVKHGI